MQPQVTSEVGSLKQVMLHRPGNEMLRLTPSNKDELLFDDILWLEKAQKEHDQFTELLESRGVEVLQFQELLAEALENPQARTEAISTVFTAESHGIAVSEALSCFAADLSNTDLAELLISGLTKNEVQDYLTGVHSSYLETLRPDEFVLNPLPNHLFTRDTSCWIYEGLSINSMCKNARRRETINAQLVYKYLPRFTNFDYPIYSHGHDAGAATLEGGDVHIIGNKSVLIGMGERTSPQGVELLAAELFASGQVERIVALEMPKIRAQMHLDTVLTMATEDTFVKYPGLGMLRSQTITPGSGKSTLNVKINPAEEMHHAIAEALDLDSIRVLEAPFNSLVAEQEQWNDGFNVLTIAPGVVVTYERNTKTNDFLIANGIEVLTIPGNEVGRGRGGPRCMSCPIIRESF